MSREIDERVVQMQFQNDKFENNVGKTINSLGKLQDALKFKNADAGLNDIQEASNKLNFGGISKALSSISEKFESMGTIGTRILQNLTDRAFGLASKLTGVVKSMTIDQIGAGFTKYAEKTQSVQTIMAATLESWKASADAAERANFLMEQGLDTTAANKIAKAYGQVASGALKVEDAAKQAGIELSEFNNITGNLGGIQYAGKQMEYVDAQLSKLNWFTDETSYAFLDMVSNIGKFTSNNIGLNESVTAMQGIATWAGISGANVNEAGRAMYNLSQALATGSVKLIDWRSIENANMATSAFKETVIETAVELGELQKTSDGVIKTIGKNAEEVTAATFNSTLAKGWFTADVLMKTLDTYGSFTDELYKATEQVDLEASKILGYMDEYRDGTIDMTEASKDAGVTAEELSKVLEHLTDSTFALGEKAFRASQEAKTFKEAIEATKDAVSSGWMKTFELIFGNYEQAKVLWTNVAEDLYSLFVESGNARNDLLESWSEMGGREDFTAGIHQTLVNLIDIKDWFTEKFNEFLPSEEIIEFLYNLTKGFREFNDNLHENTKFWDIISYLAEAFGNVLEFVVRSIDRAYKVFTILISPLKLLEPLFTAIARFIRYVAQGLNESSKNGSFFEERLDRLNRLMAPFNEAFGKFIYNLSMFIRKTGKSIQESEGLQKIFSFLRDTIFNFIAHLISFGTRIFDFFNKIHDGTAKIPDPLKKIIDFFKDIFQNAKPLDIIGNIFEKIGNAIHNVTEKIKSFKILEKITGLFNKVGNAAFDGFGKIKSVITGVFSNLKEGISISDAFTNSINKTFGLNLDKSNLLESLKTITGGAILGIGGKKLFDVFSDPDGIISAAKGFIEKLSDILESFKNLPFFGKKDDDSSGFEELAKNLKTIAIAIGIVAGSLFVLSLLNPERLANSMITLIGTFGLLALMLSKMSGDPAKTKTMNKTAKALIKMSFAALLLAWAMKSLGELDTESLLKGIIAIPVIFAIFSKISKKADTKQLGKAAGSLKAISDAISKLGASLFIFNFIKFDAILKAVGVIWFISKIFKKMTDLDPSQMETVSKAFGKFGLALLALAPALVIMNFVRPSSLLKAGAAIVGFFEILKHYGDGEKSNDMYKMAGALAVFGLALLLCTPALIAFGLVPIAGIAKAAISIFAIFEFMKNADKINVSSIFKIIGALALMGFALGLLVVPLMLFAAIPWEGLGKAAVTLIGVFAILGVAGLILSPLTPVITALAMAFMMLGAGMLMISAALVMMNIVVIFNQLAQAAMMLVRVLASKTILVVFKNLLAIFKEWVKFIPTVAATLAEGILNFIAALGNGASKVVIAAVKLGMSLLIGLRMLIPQIIKTGVDLLVAFLSGILDQLDRIVPVVFAIIIKIIDAVITFLPMLVDSLLQLLVGLINALANGIRDNADAIMAAVANILSAIVEMVLAVVQRLVGMIPGVGKKWSEAIGKARGAVQEFLAPESLEVEGEKASGGLLDGLTKGLSGAESVGEGASGGLLSGLFGGLSGEGEEAGAGVGADFLAGLGATDAQGEGNAFSMDFVQGMLDTEDDAEGAGEKDGKAGVKGAGSQISNFFNVGGDSATGFANGMTSNSSLQKIATAGAQMGKTAKGALKTEINSNSPSKEFAKIGGDSADGYAIGTEKKFGKVEKTYKMMGRLALDSALGMANEIDDILNDTSNQPVITPVVDMNMVRDAAGEIGKTFGKTSIGVQNARAVAGLTSKRGYSTQYNGNNVVEAIDGLRVDVGKLEKVMGNMQVRMDTGALVGSMVGPMDNALGARMLRRRRG